MKKSLITFILLFLTVITYAQKASVNYSEEIVSDIPSLLSLSLDNKSYLKITISSDFSAKKKAYLNCYRCFDGKVSRIDMGIPEDMTSFSISNDGLLIIEVMMKQVTDSVSLAFAVDGKIKELLIPRNYVIPSLESSNLQYILMETISDDEQVIDDEIPIFAVTAGICNYIEFNGMTARSQDFCGLRDMHKNPKTWNKIKGVGNYTFYTIKFINE